MDIIAQTTRMELDGTVTGGSTLATEPAPEYTGVAAIVREWCSTPVRS